MLKLQTKFFKEKRWSTAEDPIAIYNRKEDRDKILEFFKVILRCSTITNEELDQPQRDLIPFDFTPGNRVLAVFFPEAMDNKEKKAIFLKHIGELKYTFDEWMGKDMVVDWNQYISYGKKLFLEALVDKYYYSGISEMEDELGKDYFDKLDSVLNLKFMRKCDILSKLISKNYVVDITGLDNDSFDELTEYLKSLDPDLTVDSNSYSPTEKIYLTFDPMETKYRRSYYSAKVMKDDNNSNIIKKEEQVEIDYKTFTELICMGEEAEPLDDSISFVDLLCSKISEFLEDTGWDTKETTEFIDEFKKKKKTELYEYVK